MRFAYIDSQGNEVPIPSVDALALRIELGAVGPETQLYDAQADHWGPAHTHEIFHSLSRDSEDEGFMAPPPVAPAPPSASAPPEAEESPAPEPEPTVPGPEEEEEAAADPGDFGLTLADPLPTPETDDGEDDDAKALGDLAMEETQLGGGELELESEEAADDLPELTEPEGEAPSAEPAEEASASAGADGGGFDFGDLGSGLELEDSSSEPDDMGVEREMEFQAPEAEISGGDELALEEPMSAFEPDEPPGWMEESGPEEAEEVMDFSTATEEEEPEEAVAPVTEAPARQRRTPKDRPSPPKFKRQRSLSGPIVLVVLLMAIGVGGYYAWPIVQAQLEERNAPERPPVVMPVIPEELLPQMRELAESAIAAVVADVSQATLDPDAPQGPDDDWLAGVYLGNASQYAGIETFWSSMNTFTEGLRSADWELYHEKYTEAVAAAGLDAEVAAQITERADSGFVAAQPQRDLAYGELERLVDAALELHDFLLENEEDIVYRPGVTSATDPTVDPVLEIAAPEDDVSRMLGMFDEITEALDALGSLDRVTRDRLVAAMTARLQQVGVE